jgi:hypothetical protein
MQPTDETKDQLLNLKDVMTFLELYIQFLRSNENMQELVDSSILLRLTNEHAVKNKISGLTMHQISGLYWIYHCLGCYWDHEIVAAIEEKISKLLRDELMIQKQMDKSEEAEEGL